MASGARRQVTYAHKRNRAKPAPGNVSASSPLPDVQSNGGDGSGDSSSVLKRRSSDSQLPISKRLRSAKQAPVATPSSSPPQAPSVPSPSFFETPHPSALTEEQKFKLKTTRPAEPNQVSPFPNVRSLRSRTSSRNQKENASRRGRASKKTKFLDSPFNSRPGSAATSPQKTATNPQSSFKRTLSDTQYNPNVLHSASTTASPAYTHSPGLRARRPSAPSPPRPADWMLPHDLEQELQQAFSNPFFFPTDVDFNRPPSSLSMYGDLDADHFFDDAQGVSTPASKTTAYRQPPMDIEDDFAMDVDVEATFAAVGGPKLKEFRRDRSPWLSDSLISPPNSQEWNRVPQNDAYMQSPQRMEDDEDALSLSLGPALGGDHDLKQMFDGLAIGRLSSNRTRSLDSNANLVSTEPKPKAGRDRRGTIRASDFIKNPVSGATTTLGSTARRTRSGTIVAVQRARSLDRDGGLGEVDESEELGGWVSEDWAVAAPPSPVVTRKSRRRSGMSMLGKSFEGDELDCLRGGGAGLGLMPSPEVRIKAPSRKGKEREVVLPEDIVMEEEEDELMLKPGMVWDF
ncbi:hypothetical protein MKEN_01043400 [Mycena kentingensis (nom. inval.)]|nr:hypothetical protein MKEN_01043400 [Mycena kentingensis (nom. inval.)]